MSTAVPAESPRVIRLEKIAALRALGIDPYPSTAGRTHHTHQVEAGYDELQGQSVTVAGRLLSRRQHQNFMFADLADETGRVQLMLTRDTMPPTEPQRGSLGFDDASRLVDVGDIVEAAGVVTKTRTGQVSIDVERLRMLAKSLRPLPDKWNKITDEEVLVRQRYLDMIVNPEKRERFRLVSELQAGIRDFLRQRGFLEFTTPVLQPLYGGGRAKPFTTRVNALSRDFYLAISHELYLKRLIIAGFERVYTIGRYFRNEGIDRTHNPEFSMLETMTAYENYEFNMDLTEAMYQQLTRDVLGTQVVQSRGRAIDLGRPWRRASMLELVTEFTGIDFDAGWTTETAKAALSDHQLPPQPSIGHAMLAVFEAAVAPQLIEPTIVYGHPVDVSPLAKAMPRDDRFAERFELYINGTEQGDNWSELADPVELRRRFLAEQDRKAGAADEEAHPVDTDFLDALEFGMPPTTGVGPGIERLAMLLTDADSISDVMFFPLLRPKDDPPGP